MTTKTQGDCLPEGKIPVIRVPARPADQNPGGSIFGGWIMSYVDIAGSIPALGQHSRAGQSSWTSRDKSG
jgi:acyl-CoA thioesterase YciA